MTTIRPASATAMVALFATLTIVACSGGDRQTPPAVDPPSGPPDIRWTTAYRESAVRVTIEDPAAYYRVRGVALFGPDGESYEASEITRENLNRDRTAQGGAGGLRPSIGVGGGYSSHGGFGTGVGIGLSFPLGGGGGASADEVPETRTTTAILPVSDPERYRRTASRWEIQATLADEDGTVSYARFPAPVPNEEAR